MSKRYEDEIRDLLKGMDRFPGEGNRPPRRRGPLWLSRLIADPQRLMGGALVLTLGAWVLGGPWSRTYPFLSALSGWVQITGVVLFVVAFVMLYRRGAFAGSSSQYGSAPRWRGQVINMPRRGGVFGRVINRVRGWWRRITGSRRPPARW